MKEIIDDTIGLKCKKKKNTPEKKERESTQMFSMSSLRSAIFFFGCAESFLLAIVTS